MVPRSHVEGSSHRVRVGVDDGKGSIHFNADSCCRPVDDSGDLGVCDAFQAAEHDDRSLKFRQFVICGDDNAELVGYALDSLPWEGRNGIRRAQERVDRQFSQVCGGIDKLGPARAGRKHHGPSQLGWFSAQRRAPAKQVRQLVAVHLVSVRCGSPPIQTAGIPRSVVY
jgi:hypothetical protein